jgi:acyl-CoA thioester hydrolase
MRSRNPGGNPRDGLRSEVSLEQELAFCSSGFMRAAHPSSLPIAGLSHLWRFRVRYSETDQMGTFYNSRPLEWFECGRSELLRHHGLAYAQMEERGVFLPLVEAHVEYVGRARYDDVLAMKTVATLEGRARLRCAAEIVQSDSGRGVARGYTIHVFADSRGKPIRPPEWFLEFLRKAAAQASETTT